MSALFLLHFRNLDHYQENFLYFLLILKKFILDPSIFKCFLYSLVLYNALFT